MSERIRVGDSDALIVIDVQKDFVEEAGALYVAGVPGESSSHIVVRNILCLGEEQFGFCATSEDSHPIGHVEFDIYPPHCVQGSNGQKYVEKLREFYACCDENLIKGTDLAIIAYSIATSPDFPEHVQRLRDLGIRRVFIAGFAYTHCVGESAIAYSVQGFETFVVRDATRSVAPPYGDTELMRKKLELYGVKEIFMSDIATT